MIDSGKGRSAAHRQSAANINAVAEYAAASSSSSPTTETPTVPRNAAFSWSHAATGPQMKIHGPQGRFTTRILNRLADFRCCTMHL
jgi:hypothetical protein